MIRRLTVALFSLFLSAPALALGHVVTYGELPFSTVSQLITCGQWQRGDESGMFRVLLAYHSGQSMLFIDMVKPDASQTVLVVDRGFTIDEFDNDHAEYDISALRCQSAGEGKIRINGRSEDIEGKKSRFRIDFDAATGRYHFSRPR